MASIRKKNEKWQVQIRRKGCGPISKTFLKKSDAMEWARMMEAKADRRDMPQDTKLLDRMSLGELVRRYRDEIAIKKKCASMEVFVLNAFLRHTLCTKPLSSITRKDWLKYCDERLLTITTKSLDRELSPIRHMFRVAVEDWDFPLVANPISKIKIKIEDRRRERRVTSIELQKLLSEALKTRSEYLAPMIKLAVETGMRRGEILKIRTSDIDFNRSLLSIPETKNGECRTIPLTADASVVLGHRLVKEDEHGRIFPVTATALRLSWDRLCKKANIENLHFHDLRHEAISRFFEMGLTTPEVALISGHKDIRMLFRYAHGTQKAILEKFARSSAIT